MTDGVADGTEGGDDTAGLAVFVGGDLLLEEAVGAGGGEALAEAFEEGAEAGGGGRVGGEEVFDGRGVLRSETEDTQAEAMKEFEVAEAWL